MARLGLDHLIDEAVVKRLLRGHKEIAIRVFLCAKENTQTTNKLQEPKYF